MERQGPVWFEEGLRFECTQCGDCCTGAPGFVWVDAAEMNALAAKLGLSLEEFQEKYVRQVGKRFSLTEFANGDCVFLDGETRRCKVYENRPRQCRTWPFWDSNLRSPQTWESTCRVCPGSGKGKLYTVEEILKQSQVVKV